MSANPNSQAKEGTPSNTVSDVNFFHVAIIIVAGIFATTMAQPQVMGKLPLQNLLKAHLHVSREEMGRFFFLCGLAWYFKPFAGILTDAFPLFRTRRRHYLLLSSLLAFVSWIGLIFVPKTYSSLLYGCIIINGFMVIASTVVGAYLVETGQRLGSTGRLTSLRQVVSNACTLLNGPIAGFLASGAFAMAAGVNAFVVLSVFPVAWVFLRERRIEDSADHPLHNAAVQLKTIFRSRDLWFGILFIGLFYFAPGLGTILYYRQTDDLKFNQEFIGTLQSFAGAFGIIGAVIYSRLIKKLSLKSILVVGILVCSLTNFFYLLYNGHTSAILIDSQNGLFFTVAEVALLDLAARATPKGCEGLGYSLILSVRNLALFGADWLGSYLADTMKWSYSTLVILNSMTTLVVLVLVPLIPKALLASKDR